MGNAGFHTLILKRSALAQTQKTAEDAKWYRLDNAAKLYPFVTSAKDSHVFRLAVDLKTEVDPAILQQAVLVCKPRFPTIYVKLKKGLFWYYLEANEKDPIVKPESPFVCSMMETKSNNGYFFTIFYYKNRISLEMFHGISDGGGALEFLKSVICNYFRLQGFEIPGEQLVLDIDEKPTQKEAEDSYLLNYTREKIRRGRMVRAYRTSGTQFYQEGIGVISGRVRTDGLLALAKKKNATVSQYLAALLTYSIIMTGDAKKLSKLPVCISIPVNMRKFYGSKTLRNFSLVFHTSILCKDKKPTFDEILLQIKEQFKSELTLPKLQNSLNSNVAFEKSAALKLCPLFLKWFFMKLGHFVLGTLPTTATMSNVGNIPLPSSMKDLIEGVDACAYVGNNFTHTLCLISSGDTTSVSFSRRVYETDIERMFFSHLGQNGLDVEVQSNLWEEHA